MNPLLCSTFSFLATLYRSSALILHKFCHALWFIHRFRLPTYFSNTVYPHRMSAVCSMAPFPDNMKIEPFIKKFSVRAINVTSFLERLEYMITVHVLVLDIIYQTMTNKAGTNTKPLENSMFAKSPHMILRAIENKNVDRSYELHRP